MFSVTEWRVHPYDAAPHPCDVAHTRTFEHPQGEMASVEIMLTSRLTEKSVLIRVTEDDIEFLKKLLEG